MFKRRVLVGPLLVLAAALALPAGTMAAPGYSYQTIYNRCDGRQVEAKVKIMAAGSTSANKLEIDAFGTHKQNGQFKIVKTFAPVIKSFAANGQQHALAVAKTYTESGTKQIKIVFRLRVWHGSTLLASSLVQSVTC